MKRAKILVIEGTDGSGKATQSERLLEYLKGKKLKVKMFSFPIYDSATGRIVGGPYLGKEEMCPSYFEETSANVDPLISIMYLAADRRYNLLKNIESEIYKNDVIIFDRYTTSNMGHQAGKAKNKKQKEQILNFIETLEYDLLELPRPDKVIFLHMPFEASKELRKGRKFTDGNECNESHLKHAEKSYVEVSKMYNWHYINCLKTKKYTSVKDIKSIDEISDEIIKVVDTLFDEKSVQINKMTRF